MPGEFGEWPPDGFDDGGIHLDGRHMGRAAGERRQHVAAAAGADDECLGIVNQVIGDGRQVVAQKLHCSQVAVKALDWRAGHSVDEQQGVIPLAARGDGLFPLLRRDAPEKREYVRLVDGDAGVDVPLFVDDGRFLAAGFVHDDAYPRRGEIARQ